MSSLSLLRRPAAVLAAAALLLAARATARSEEVSIRWLGQSAFYITTPDGVRILMDPVSSSTGYEVPPVKSDVVTISHEHADHNAVQLALGPASILRGLAPGGSDWNHVDFEIGDARISSIGSYHDKEKGAQRGLNAIFVVELPGFKLVHLGDLGHVLDEAQVQPLRGADVLLVPVGGAFTIDAADAARVVEQLQPKSVVIPMHYKTAVLKVKELATADEFLKGHNPVQVPSSEYKFDTASPPKSRTYVVLNYK